MTSTEELAQQAVEAARNALDASEAVLAAVTAEPEPGPPEDQTPFERAWAAVQPPELDWSPVKSITSQQALQSWLGNRKPGDHVRVTGFQHNGRLEIRGGGPCWLECDPTFKIRNAVKGTSNIGLWLVGVTGVHITGFPQCFDCGNQGLRAQGCVETYIEVDCYDNGGNGALIDEYEGRPHGIYKIKGGGNGRGAMPPGAPGHDPAYYVADIDPHAQKGTGVHMVNVWSLDPGSVVMVDCDRDQPYGAGIQTTACLGNPDEPVVLAIRADTLSCDVNQIPPSPSGGRQSAGNAWQPWGDQHRHVIVEAIEVGSCARGLDALGSFQDCVIEHGLLGSHRLAPAWKTAAGITLEDVAPTP